MTRHEVLKELMERRARREADARQAEVGRVDGHVKLEELTGEWRSAQDDATGAYAAWCEAPGPDSYAVYRAAQDRADEAQDALWQQHILTSVAPGYERWIVS